MVHHVASLYPLEVELARGLASGNPITEVTKAGIDKMNAEHAQAHANVDRQEALTLLRENSQQAAEDIRSLTDAELDAAASVSLYHDAPLTAQFFIEDHAMRHSFHHLGKIKASL